MKKLILAIGVLAVLNCFCAEKKKSPFAAIDEARGAFNKLHGEVFRGTSAMDYRVADDETRFDRAKGEAVWVFAMPFKNDSRVKFISARYRDGAFISGELLKFGLKSENIDEKAFDEIRRENAMLAIKAGTSGKGRVAVFYPAGKVKDSHRNNLIRYGVHLKANPEKHFLGSLFGIDKVLGVNMKDVKYVYSITTSDGDVIEMGSENKGSRMVVLMRKALEQLYPKKKGLFSDRDIVDIYCTAIITYRPVAKGQDQSK
jgi:hypothetical protein